MIISHSYSYLLTYRIYINLFKTYSFRIFLPFYFLKCPCRVLVLAIRKKRASESSDRRRVLNQKIRRVVTFGTLRYFKSSTFKRVKVKSTRQLHFTLGVNTVNYRHSETGKWRFLKASWLQNHRINLRLADKYPSTG